MLLSHKAGYLRLGRAVAWCRLLYATETKYGSNTMANLLPLQAVLTDLGLCITTLIILACRCGGRGNGKRHKVYHMGEIDKREDS